MKQLVRITLTRLGKPAPETLLVQIEGESEQAARDRAARMSIRELEEHRFAGAKWQPAELSVHRIRTMLIAVVEHVMKGEPTRDVGFYQDDLKQCRDWLTGHRQLHRSFRIGDNLKTIKKNPVQIDDPEGWTCKSNKNTIGTCVYDGLDDPIHDHCLFCDEPEERK